MLKDLEVIVALVAKLDETYQRSAAQCLAMLG